MKNDDYVDKINKLKSILIVTELQKGTDKTLSDFLEIQSHELYWDLDFLLIDKNVWSEVTIDRKYSPQLVFSHPDILIINPETIMYYRSMSALSVKSVKASLGAIESLERGSQKKKLSMDKALSMARHFNSSICAIIRDCPNWTLDDGRRTILASMGINLDGRMRNKIGTLAENKMQRLILKWLIEKELLISPNLTLEHLESVVSLPKNFELSNSITMRFGSDPDVSFSHDNELLAILEIKGGVDPAGALERYGAAQKTFLEAKSKSPQCKTFFVCAVTTDEVERRTKLDGRIEKSFDLVKILDDESYAGNFFIEIFHHALRIT